MSKGTRYVSSTRVLQKVLHSAFQSQQSFCSSESFLQSASKVKFFIKDLKFSADLSDEMRKIVDPNTDQVSSKMMLLLV